MSSIVGLIRWAISLPPPIRRDIILYEIEVQLYRFWCKLTGKHFKRPVSERVSRELGKCYLVIKKVPGVSLCVFGRCFQVLRLVELEMVELDCPGKSSAAKTFLYEGGCEHCGRAIKMTEKDRPLG